MGQFVVCDTRHQEEPCRSAATRWTCCTDLRGAVVVRTEQERRVERAGRLRGRSSGLRVTAGVDVGGAFGPDDEVDGRVWILLGEGKRCITMIVRDLARAAKGIEALVGEVSLRPRDRELAALGAPVERKPEGQEAERDDADK